MEYKGESFNIAQSYHFEAQSNDVPMCQEKGCQNSSIPCEIPAGIDSETNEEYAESYEYYCPEHAAENGFCCCCGIFIAGWRDFSDLCENCEDQVREDDHDDLDDYYEGFYDEY